MASADAFSDSVRCWLRSIRFQTLDYDVTVPVSSAKSDPLDETMFCCYRFRPKTPEKLALIQQLDSADFQTAEEFQVTFGMRMLSGGAEVVEERLAVDYCVITDEIVVYDDIFLVSNEIPPQFGRIRWRKVSNPAANSHYS